MSTFLATISDSLKQKYYVISNFILLYAFILGSAYIHGYYSTFNINIFEYLGFWDIIFRTLYALIILIIVSGLYIILWTIISFFISQQLSIIIFCLLSLIIIIYSPFALFNFGNNFAQNIYKNKSYLHAQISFQDKGKDYKFIGYANGNNFFTDLKNETIFVIPNSNSILFKKFDSNELKGARPNHVFSL